MLQQPFDNGWLSLDEGEHLGSAAFARQPSMDRGRKGFTSTGFLLRNTELILAKCEAMIVCVFISSGDLSRTVSQKGTRSCWCSFTQVSTMDHISLHSTSVAT